MCQYKSSQRGLSFSKSPSVRICKENHLNRESAVKTVVSFYVAVVDSVHGKGQLEIRELRWRDFKKGATPDKETA